MSDGLLDIHSRSKNNVSFEELAGNTTLNLLRQRNFTIEQYTTIVFQFTALKYYKEEFWKEVLSYLKQVELPNAISYMQLHSCVSVVAKHIDIQEEMKLLTVYEQSDSKDIV